MNKKMIDVFIIAMCIITSLIVIYGLVIIIPPIRDQCMNCSCNSTPVVIGGYWQNITIDLTNRT